MYIKSIKKTLKRKKKKHDELVKNFKHDNDKDGVVLSLVMKVIFEISEITKFVDL